MRKNVELTGVSCAGRSIIEILWEYLDAEVEKVEDMADIEDDGGDHADWHEYGLAQGGAQALARAIAVMRNPYAPDVYAIKIEAMDRYDDRVGE